MFFNVENPTGHYRLGGDDWVILQCFVVKTRDDAVPGSISQTQQITA